MRKYILLLILITSSIFFAGCNPLDSKVKAGLQVITDETVSSLFLDSQYLDKTPFISKNIKPGRYHLEIVPEDPNLAPYETDINLNKGLLTVVTWEPATTPETSGGVIYELEALQNKNQAEVSFITIPDNAIINFDNQEQQFSPLVLNNLEPGHHEYQVTLPSYDKQQHTVNVVAGHRLNVFVKLAKTKLAEIEAQPSPQDQEETATVAAELENSEATTAVKPPKVRIKSTNFFNQGKEVLRVRNQAGAAGDELGFAEVGSEYRYLGKTENNWHQIDFNRQEGWVSGQYAELIKE